MNRPYIADPIGTFAILTVRSLSTRSSTVLGIELTRLDGAGAGSVTCLRIRTESGPSKGIRLILGNAGISNICFCLNAGFQLEIACQVKMKAALRHAANRVKSE